MVNDKKENFHHYIKLACDATTIKECNGYINHVLKFYGILNWNKIYFIYKSICFYIFNYSIHFLILILILCKGWTILLVSIGCSLILRISRLIGNILKCITWWLLSLHIYFLLTLKKQFLNLWIFFIFLCCKEIC